MVSPFLYTVKIMDISLLFKETPWWVYALFVFLVLIGLKATKPRWITLRQLLILPVVFMILSVFWLTERLHGQYYDLIFWLIGLSIGTFFGWLLVRPWKIEVDKHKKALALPPTWSSLILILLFFAVRYFFSYHYEVHPEAASHLFLADSIASGTMTGIFIGRSVQLFQKYFIKIR